MSDLLWGLLGWGVAALVVGLLVSRFLRQPDADALDPPTRLDYLRHLLPGSEDEPPASQPIREERRRQ